MLGEPAGAGGDVDRVHRRRLDPDPHLPGPGLRRGDVGYLKRLRASETANDYSFHVISFVAVPECDPLRTLDVLLSIGKKVPKSA